MTTLVLATSREHDGPLALWETKLIAPLEQTTVVLHRAATKEAAVQYHSEVMKVLGTDAKIGRIE